MENDVTIEETEELKKLVPIDLLTEKERMYVVGLSKNGYPQVVKYIHQLHPKEISLKFAKTYYDLYIKDNVYENNISKRNKEIVCAAKNHETQTGFCDLVKSSLSKGVNSAYGVGFIEGCVWADAHPSNEVLNNICKWLEENLDRYEYYGTIDKETLLDDFLREFSK